MRNSPLLRPGVTTFIDGPSQQTLPAFHFDAKLQLALIDGPHAYPFPDLEYYYLYPHLEAGALLVLDDIHIRTIHNLFDFLKREPMFRLDAVVRSTALFTRTDAPTFNPLGDSWEQQRYNRQTHLRYTWRSRLAQAIPRSLHHVLLKRNTTNPSAASDIQLSIISPASGNRVTISGQVSGTASIPAGAHLWVLIHRKDVTGWWPQGGGPAEIAANKWTVAAAYGDPADAGQPFEIAAAVVSHAVNDLWLQWVRSVKETGLCPPVALPFGPGLHSISYRTVIRQ